MKVHPSGFDLFRDGGKASGGDLYYFSNDPRARARFVSARQQAKKFIVKRRGYKPPDFVRMILDLRNLGWSHEKISYVLGCSANAVSSWAVGSRPFYDHGDAFIQLWQEMTWIERYPREGEFLTYKYDIGQLDLLDQLDGVIEQLDSEIGK
ncbi:hypothetical protein QLH32_05605 [Acinetobacter corruptisaponis]|uniref:Uncharacterized protein n=1 Tax=Acinetobacter corruptisaponis TaxID=3045147 RepID=A0ABY8S800_9GAMM|nr:hypothetical protein [Acinetobacter sp. KCTC 92772]WHP06942.1 hypothetical protein QLH32_05605 [Acinetobacter sp. KCTC 92772]